METVEAIKEDECFVCLERGGQRRCRCALSVHDECLQRLMDKVPAHNGSCTVCHAQYTDVEATTHRACVILESFRVFTVPYFVLGAHTLLLVLIFMTTSLHREYAWIVLVACCMEGISFFSVVVLHVVHRQRLGSLCCCQQLAINRFRSIRHSFEARSESRPTPPVDEAL